MLFRQPDLKEIVKLSENPAEITKIRKFEDPDRSDILHYRIYATIDVNQVINLDAYNLVAEVFTKKPTPPISTTKLRSGRRWGQATKRAERKVRRIARENRKKRLAKRNVDLTKFISNDLTNVKRKNLTRVQKNSLRAQSKIVAPTDPFTVNRSVSFKPATPGILSPVGIKKKKKTSTPISSTVIQGVKSNTPLSKTISKSFLKVKKDPGAISAASMSGPSKMFSSPSLTRKVSSFVFTSPTSLPIIPVFRLAPNKKTIRFTIRINRGRLANTSAFYLRLELEDSRGVKVAEDDIVIPHARILNTFLTPRSVPTLEAEYVKPGVMSVRASAPKDKKVTTLKIFRRVAAPIEGGTDPGSEWEEVFNSTSSPSDDFVFRDNIATSRPVLYRSVVYGENSKPSEKFASTVVLPLKQFKAKQSGSLTAVSSIAFSGSNTFVRVSVKDIPEDVVTVMVRRFNVTDASDADRKASKGSGFTYVGSTPQEQQVSTQGLSSGEFVGSATFIDESIKRGKNYRFVPVGITKTGKEIIGSSSILQVPFSPSRAQVSMRVSSPKLSPSSGDIDTSMTIRARFTEFGFSEVRRSLDAGQQKDLFNKDLLEDRDKFEKLITFLVERKNNKTGEVESFGVVEQGVFLDNEETRGASNVKEMDPGVEYTYTVTALVSTPETLFPTLTKADVDIKTLVAFKRRVAKFQNPLALSRATLMSTARQLDNTKPSALEQADPRLAGRTNVEVSYEFRAPISKTGKPRIRIEKFRRFNRVVWQYSDPDRIDHFKVYVLSSGGRVLIDTVHCDASTSDFYYRHYNKDYGVDYRYMIQPVDLSYRELEPIFTRAIRPIDIFRKFGISRSSRIERL